MSTPLSGPILCPVDFSDLSASALRLAARIGSRCSCPVTALHAQWFEVPPYLTAGAAAQIQLQLRESLDDARSALRRFASETVAGGPPAIRVEEGDPREAILRVAEAIGSSLIVMGTHGRSGIARWTLGSVAEHVMRDSRIPVLTIRPGHLAESIASIVCAVNDSEVSRNALAHAAKLALCLGAKLIVIHVADGENRRAIPDLCAWVGQGGRPDCDLREVARRGHPAEQILLLIAESNAELLVIGAGHKMFLDKSVIGATTNRLVRHAPCAVLTVTEGTASDAL